MALPSLRFEKLQTHHIPAILEIESVSNGAPWTEQAFRNELTNPQSIFRVALSEGQLVAYGGVWLCVDEAHITTIAVSPDHRRQGIGRRLMIELMTEAKSAGMTCSTLEVRAGNEGAIQMYEHLGYDRAAVRRKYYPDNREDAVIMWLYNLTAWNP